MANRPVILSAATYIEGLVLLVDGYPSERHVLTSRIGGESIEEGTRISDHVTPLPTLLKLSGIVSDLGGAQRPIEAWDAIRRMHRAGQPVRVVTEWAIYPRMIVERCEANSAARGMRFNMDLREILIVAAPPPDFSPVVSPEARRSPELYAAQARQATRGTITTPEEARARLEEGVRSARMARGRQQLLDDRLSGSTPSPFTTPETTEELQDEVGAVRVSQLSPAQLERVLMDRAERMEIAPQRTLTSRTVATSTGRIDVYVPAPGTSVR